MMAVGENCYRADSGRRATVGLAGLVGRRLRRRGDGRTAPRIDIMSEDWTEAQLKVLEPLVVRYMARELAVVHCSVDRETLEIDPSQLFDGSPPDVRVKCPRCSRQHYFRSLNVGRPAAPAD